MVMCLAAMLLTDAAAPSRGLLLLELLRR